MCISYMIVLLSRVCNDVVELGARSLNVVVPLIHGTSKITPPELQAWIECLPEDQTAGCSLRPWSKEGGPTHPCGRRKAEPVSYTHLRAHETRHDLVCR